MTGANKLSQAGKEILIKSVAQALPTYIYIMGVFKLPLTLCDDFMQNYKELLVGCREWSKEDTLVFLGDNVTTKEQWWIGFSRLTTF
jgi:hypothetical protein